MYNNDNNIPPFVEYSGNNSRGPIFPENYLYGHAYTPTQYLSKTFSPEYGLKNGSIFPELISPYEPGQSIDFINYLKNGGVSSND